MAELTHLQPRILLGLKKIFGKWNTVAFLLRVNMQVMNGWRHEGYTYSVACRLKFELDQLIRDLKEYSDEMDVIIRERRNLRGYRFPPEQVRNRQVKDRRIDRHKRTGPPQDVPLVHSKVHKKEGPSDEGPVVE